MTDAPMKPTRGRFRMVHFASNLIRNAFAVDPDLFVEIGTAEVCGGGRVVGGARTAGCGEEPP